MAARTMAVGLALCCVGGCGSDSAAYEEGGQAGESAGGAGPGSSGSGGTVSTSGGAAQGGAATGGDASGGNAAGGTSGDPGEGDCAASGELAPWHRVALLCEGPEASEDGTPNPFTDYRMEVTFSRGSDKVVVQGHFAADGDAANTGATSGKVWRAYFMPPSSGRWDYVVSFAKGSKVAVEGGGEKLAGTDGKSGHFTIGTPRAEGLDLRTRGLLEHRQGERYLRFKGNGKVYIEGGVDSPENLLAFKDIDNTVDCSGNNSGILHEYPTHLADYREGDPTWAGGKGKALIGAINYLASTGVNAQYFLTMTREYNGVGDDNRIVPWTSCDERHRFDVSKLDQWEIVFDHLTRNGMLLHVVTQETENDHLLNGGTLGFERKLYYRELISRFSHHPALQWNLGEENTNDSTQVKAFADYIKDVDPYDHPTVLHTYPGDQSNRYTPLLGHATFNGPTLQFGDIPVSTSGGLYGEIKKWLAASESAGRSWYATATEASGSNAPTPNTAVTSTQRIYWMWASVMSGGAGFEWYLKRGGSGHAFDHSLENFAEFDQHWKQSGHLVRFFEQVLQGAGVDPQKLTVQNEVTPQTTDWVLAESGSAYLIFLREGGSVELNLSGIAGSFSSTWFNPRTGVSTAGPTLSGGGTAALGQPPNETTEDWVVLVTK